MPQPTPRNKMQLTFSSTVTENAYIGITMNGLVLNQNSSVLGLDLDNSNNRGSVPGDSTVGPGTNTLEMYAGATWTGGLSGSYLKLLTPGNIPIPVGASAFRINGEPYVSGGTVKYRVEALGATYVIPLGTTWRAYALADPQDDYHFGGATFSQLDLPFKTCYIPQPQVAFKNGYGGGIYDRIAPNGATFTNAEWNDYTSNSNNPPQISLFWEESTWASIDGSNSREWLNYDPHYFLFFYKPSKKKSGQPRKPSGFVHPPSILGPNTYGQGAGPTSSGFLRGYPSSVGGRVGGSASQIPSGLTAGVSYVSGWRRTEWPVGPTPCEPLRLDDGTQDAYDAFHPNQYYRSSAVPNTNKPNLLPSNLTTQRVLTPWGSPVKTTPITAPADLRNQHHLYFRFAIGIFYYSPSGVRKVIFGPMSDTIRITPRTKFYGVQSSGYAVEAWAINWQARIV